MDLDKYDKNPIVYLREEGILGVVVDYGAHVSLVRYMLAGWMYEEFMDNDEFVVIDNILIEHVDEED